MIEKKEIRIFLMKIGIVSIFFGIGLGFGLMLEEYTTKDFWVPFLLFVSTGVGFVLANIFGRVMSKKEDLP
jgi:branched-subunit amino acid permease